MVVTLGANKQDRRNKQILKLEARDLERPAKSKKYDSTLDERERTYSERSREPRLTEYR
jgi:hypothetical protein